MRRVFLILLLCFSIFQGCAPKKSLQEKFNALKRIDYSEFRNMSIVNRKGVYFVTYHRVTYKIKMSFFRKNISSIEMANKKDTNILLTEKDTDYIARVLKSFIKIDVLGLSVDEKENVLLSLPWYDRCTYYFLRLSSSSTLKELKKQYYRNYEGNWYLNKECSER